MKLTRQNPLAFRGMLDVNVNPCMPVINSTQLNMSRSAERTQAFTKHSIAALIQTERERRLPEVMTKIRQRLDFTLNNESIKMRCVACFTYI